MESWPVWVRWMLVIPGAIGGVLLSLIVVHAGMVPMFGPIEAWAIWMIAIELIIQSMVSAVVFVVVPAYVAPHHSTNVAVLCAWIVTALCMYAIHVALTLPHLYPTWMYMAASIAAMGCANGASAVGRAIEDVRGASQSARRNVWTS